MDERRRRRSDLCRMVVAADCLSPTHSRSFSEVRLLPDGAGKARTLFRAGASIRDDRVSNGDRLFRRLRSRVARRRSMVADLPDDVVADSAADLWAAVARSLSP